MYPAQIRPHAEPLVEVSKGERSAMGRRDSRVKDCEDVETCVWAEALKEGERGKET